jgi:RNA polymerase sigma-70 factor (ECF subfamily)
MGAGEPLQARPSTPGTLGHVLYGGKPKAVPTESEWVALVQAMAAGDQAALHALYDRTHRLVYTLTVRIVGNRETAEELTVDVFHDAWRRAARYDPADGTVLGWIMNQARSRAIDRLRFEQRKKRSDPGFASEDVQEFRDGVERQQESRALQGALGKLSTEERDAVQAAFYSELSHAEVAERLNEPLGTIKTRIRSALQKMKRILGEGAKTP